MLAREKRLHTREDFALVMRRGNRAGGSFFTVHFLAGDEQTKAGLIVSRAVGNAVVRKRVSRQLRHILASHWDEIPVGTLVVVRAAAACKDTETAVLDAEFTRQLQRVVRKLSR